MGGGGEGGCGLWLSSMGRSCVDMEVLQERSEARWFLSFRAF